MPARSLRYTGTCSGDAHIHHVIILHKSGRLIIIIIVVNVMTKCLWLSSILHDTPE